MCFCTNHKIYFFQSIFNALNRAAFFFKITNNVLTYTIFLSKQYSPCVILRLGSYICHTQYFEHKFTIQIRYSRMYRNVKKKMLKIH